MAIQFNVQNARTGAAATQSLNTSRVERILTAGSLNEAQRMGFFDKLKDKFRGGAKAEAIRQLYDQVTAPQAHDAQPLNMLHRFERLRALANDEHQAQFTSAVQLGTQDQRGQWTFSLSVGENQVYKSAILTEQPGSYVSDFQQAQTMHQGINDSIARFRREGGADPALAPETTQATINAIRDLMGDTNNEASQAEGMPLSETSSR